MSTAQTMLSIFIGGPLLLLAVGVIFHAYVVGRQSSMSPMAINDLEAHVEALATESADALLVDLQETVERMQSQLARQRDSLANLMSEDARRPRGMMTPAILPAMTPAMATAAPLPASGTYVERTERAERAQAPEPPRRSFEYSAAPAMPSAPSVPAAPAARAGGAAARAEHPLRLAVAQLASEGLSDRAIARQLRIGLEEVRIARMRVAR